MACEDLRILLQGNAGCYSNSLIATENGKKFMLDNPNGKIVCRVHIDNCLITDQTIKKCDFLFNILDDNKFYLVELKGKAIDIAIAQIVSSFENLNQKIKASPQSYTGIIVSSAVPKAANQRFANLQDKTYRDKKLLIKRKNNLFIESI